MKKKIEKFKYIEALLVTAFFHAKDEFRAIEDLRYLQPSEHVVVGSYWHESSKLMNSLACCQLFAKPNREHLLLRIE